MKTENIKLEIDKAIAPFIKKLSKREEVLSIILLGGLGKRKFLDEFSDVDLSIVTSKRNKDKFPLPFEFHYEHDSRVIEFNIHQLILEDELDLSTSWTEGKIEAYANAIIVYDTNNYAKQILDTRVVFDKRKAYNRLIWIMQQYEWRGQIHSVRSFKRGCPAASHDLLNQCVELLLESVFLLNERYLPHRKWIFVFLDDLNIDKDLSTLFMDALLVKDFSYQSITERIEILNKIYEKISKLVYQKHPNFPLNPYEYYYRNFIQLSQTTLADKKFFEATGRTLISSNEDKKLFGQICFDVDKL